MAALPALGGAFPRLGNHATPGFITNGNRAEGFSVTCTTGTAKLLYSANDDDREVFFQNLDSTYGVYLGTSSSVSTASSNAHWFLRAGQDATTNGAYNIYCIGESGAGASGVNVTGNLEYQLNDGR